MDDLLCEISTVEAVCENLLAEAEEEFNSVSFQRKRRDVTGEGPPTRWLIWRRRDSSSEGRRTKRSAAVRTLTSQRVRNLMFPMGVLKSKDVNENQAKKNRDNSNFMGVLTGLIVQSLGKDIGMTRYSSFLTNLGSKDSMGADDFLAEFSKEFGEERAAEVRLLAEKTFGQILSEHEKDLDEGKASSKLGGALGATQTSGGVPSPKEQEVVSDLLPDENLPQNGKKNVKVKFTVEGKGVPF